MNTNKFELFLHSIKDTTNIRGLERAARLPPNKLATVFAKIDGKEGKKGQTVRDLPSEHYGRIAQVLTAKYGGFSIDGWRYWADPNSLLITAEKRVDGVGDEAIEDGDGFIYKKTVNRQLFDHMDFYFHFQNQ
jgi:hypothetical protein